jgi:hypothetical protein
MNKRDVFLDEEYWDDQVQIREQAIVEFEKALAHPEATWEDHRRLSFAIFRFHLELLIARYSRGDETALLQQAFPQIIDALDSYHRLRPRETLSFNMFSQYVFAIWLVSLGILFDIDIHSWERLVGLIDNKGEDALFERLVALRTSDCREATKLRYPRPYEPLYQALDVTGNKRDTLISQFLKRYYRGMRHAHWHDSHLSRDAGFFGYWCFELAAFVKMLNISDHSFSDNIYYPRDLVIQS